MLEDAKRALRDARLLILAWLVLAITRLALLIVSYRRLAPVLPVTHCPPPHALACRVEVAIMRASRLVPGSTCLAEACAGRILLRIKGYGATMRVGVQAAPDGGLRAHAWLVSDGTVILGSRVPDFGGYRDLADFS